MIYVRMVPVFDCSQGILTRVLWFGGVLYRGQFDPRPLFVSLMPFTADTTNIMLVSMVMLIHSKVSSVSYFIAPENKLTDIYNYCRCYSYC